MFPETKEKAPILHVYLPRLPHLDPESVPASDSWIEEFYWTNCSARLVELQKDGQTERDLLESCSISKEDGSYRLQIKKGRRFHQGEEITAADVISCLLRVARRAGSASQLGKLLRYQGLACEKSFKLHSRYRFEIFLQGLVPDLLERLALPECGIYRSGGISSGDWFLAKSEAGALWLKPHPERPRGERIYEEVLIQTLDQAPSGGSHGAEAYLQIFPATISKVQQANALSGVMSLELLPEMQLAVWLQAKPKGAEDLRAALQAFARHKNGWNLRRLAQLYGKHNFSVDATIHEPRASETRKNWTFAYDPDLFSKLFLEDLAAFAAHHFQLEIVFKPTAENVDAWLFVLPEYSREGSLRTAELGLRILYRHAIGGFEQRPFLEKLLHDTSVAHRDRLLREWLHKLVHHPQFLPLGKSALVAISNRMLAGELPVLGTLSFDSVGDSRPRQESKELQEATVSALGSAVQMLAHDIRRPFGTLEGVLSLLASTDDPLRLKELAQQYLPHVRRMTHTINEMISDILEMGSTGETLTEPISPLSALEESLRLLLPSKKLLSFACGLKHRLMLEADTYKLTRIFSNILNNAIEATPEGGSISFSSRDLIEGGASWMEISIHNSGSYISPEKCQRIFEAFYTEGKDQGTGLGLAIVKKFVLAHGGHLVCRSDRSSGTSFVVTLPSSYKRDDLPHDAAERIAELWSTISPQQPEPTLPISLSSFENPEKIQLALLWIDDDPLDLGYGRDLIGSLNEAHFELNFESLEDPEQALDRARTKRYDLIIIDYQLGSSDGLGWIPRFRLLQPEARIALHSHRSSSAIYEAALQVGADCFIPKPLQKGTLIDFCESSLRKRRELIVLEDDPLFTEIWQSYCAEEPSLSLRCFLSPKAMMDAWEKNPDLLKNCSALVSDGVFPEGSGDGPAFLRELRRRLPDLQLFLCTHLHETGQVSQPWKRLSKEPEAIASFVKNLQSGHI